MHTTTCVEKSKADENAGIVVRLRIVVVPTTSMVVLPWVNFSLERQDMCMYEELHRDHRRDFCKKGWPPGDEYGGPTDNHQKNVFPPRTLSFHPSFHYCAGSTWLQPLPYSYHGSLRGKRKRRGCKLFLFAGRSRALLAQLRSQMADFGSGGWSEKRSPKNNFVFFITAHFQSRVAKFAGTEKPI